MRLNHIRRLLLGIIVSFCWVGSTVSYAYELNPLNQNTDPIIFTEESTFPESVENALLDEVLYQQSAKLVHYNEKAYVVLSLGWCNSTGYDIYVTRAELKDTQLIVWAKVQRPAPGSFVGWGYTLPMKIISVPNTNQQIQHLTVIYN